MAPEIHLGRDYEGVKVDLFATGIILFTTMTQRPPFRTANPNDPHYSLIAAGQCASFWEAHATAEGGEDIFSAEFKDLFEKLMSLNPSKRPSIVDILAHPWMQGAEATEAEI